MSSEASKSNGVNLSSPTIDPKHRRSLSPSCSSPVDAVKRTSSFQGGAERSQELMLKQLVICCGPSGAGKSTLIKRLMKNHPGKFGFSVSHTTRAPREGEENGVDYHFVDQECMQQLLDTTEQRRSGKLDLDSELERKKNYMIEYAHVHKNVYGTSSQAISDVVNSVVAAADDDGLVHHKKCILDIDVQGVEQVKKLADWDPKSMYIFIVPPSIDELEKRLRGRGTETEDKIITRLNNAEQEMTYLDKEDGFWDAIVINDDVEKAYRKFEHTVLTGTQVTITPSPSTDDMLRSA